MNDLSASNLIKKFRGKSISMREPDYSNYNLSRLKGICVHDALYIFYEKFLDDLFDYIDIPSEENIKAQLNLFFHKAFHLAVENLIEQNAIIYEKNKGIFLYECLKAMQWELELIFKRLYKDFKLGYSPAEIIERNKPLLIEENIVLKLPKSNKIFGKPDIIYRNDKDLILTDYKVYKFRPSKYKLKELEEIILVYVIIYNQTFKRKITKAQIRLLNQREDIPIDISGKKLQDLVNEIGFKR